MKSPWLPLFPLVGIQSVPGRSFTAATTAFPRHLTDTLPSQIGDESPTSFIAHPPSPASAPFCPPDPLVPRLTYPD